MRVPRRFDERLVTAFRQEPGRSEWHMLNAFTWLATHGGLPEANSAAIQRAAGSWTEGFDVVTARLPRPMAMQVGAHILEEAAV